MPDVQVSERDREAGRDAANSWLEGHNPLALGAIIAQAIAQGRAEEREACCEAVDAVASRFRAAHDPMNENAADECAAAIRARGEK